LGCPDSSFLRSFKTLSQNFDDSPEEVLLNYGHQFYLYPYSKRVEYLNAELLSGRFNSLEELVDNIIVDVGEIMINWGNHLFFRTEQICEN